MRSVLLGSVVGALVISSRAFALVPDPPTAGLQAALPTATLSGRVVDSSGATIAGAQVRVRPHGAGASVSTATDSQGVFTATVTPGTYDVAVAATGFDDATSTVAVSQQGATIEVAVQVAGVHEAVSVAARAPYHVPAVSSATKTPTPLVDVPQSVTVVSSALIADQRMTSMADVARYMPGVGFAQGEGNRDTPILRGNSSTADFFVDGARDDVQYFRDTYNAERIEALKGPNAMMFGRGGVGGVINRVTRKAGWGQSREAAIQFGSWGNKRVTTDLGTVVGGRLAVRATAMYENSDSYRRGVAVERWGVNPTLAFRAGPNTVIRAGYERFHDERTADRGVSSFNGRPVAADATTFFGDPAQSPTHATVDLLSGTIEHQFSPSVTLTNRLSYAQYDKFYQNVFPGVVNAAGTAVAINAYNNGTERQNLFNQTDLVISRRFAGLGHTLLLGSEFGRQETANLRMTGYFGEPGSTLTSIAVPLAAPTVAADVTFRPSATDANNRGVATIAAVYAQDQLALSQQFRAVVGLRLDRFQTDVTDNRTTNQFAGDDTLLSPRLGLIYKPAPPISLYGSYSLTYLPRAGEQLTSLSLTNQALEPETFRNYEIGAKWDAPAGVSLTAAVYRLNRGNVVVPDPVDATRSLLVDAQHTVGLELGVNGQVTRAWSIAGGYAYQDGEITRSISATARAGASLAQLPAHSLSLWNRYDVTSKFGAGLGVISRSSVFTSTDNTVILPRWTRIDAAVYYQLSRTLRAQVNVENVFDADYYLNAHSNTNITPGSPRALRFAMTTQF